MEADLYFHPEAECLNWRQKIRPVEGKINIFYHCGFIYCIFFGISYLAANTNDHFRLVQTNERTNAGFYYFICFRDSSAYGCFLIILITVFSVIFFK